MKRRNIGAGRLASACHTTIKTVALVALLTLAGRGGAGSLQAQSAEAPHAAEGMESVLDSLVARALAVNPSVRAAAKRLDAARARVDPAGALPDPMLSVGIMNVPIADRGSGDPMTMSTVGVGQRLPYPGKLPLARRAAELEVRAAEARAEEVRRGIEEEVRTAYYVLAFLDRSLEVIDRSQGLVVDLIALSESRYGVGTGGQQDILKARVEAARLAEEAVTLSEARRSRLARLNALLDRPADAPLEAARVPERIARAAIPENLSRVRFVSDRLGARVGDSPLPTAELLRERAVRASPELKAHAAAIAAQAARVELVRKSHLPDFEVSVQYGQRVDRGDMASLMVSVPLPVRRRARQDQRVAEAEAELAAMQADHHAMVNQIEADVTAAHAALERERARLALFARSILPQGRAALESAVAAYPVGRADFLTLIENQSAVYDYEITYFSALTDFASSLARLERLVGGEVLP